MENRISVLELRRRLEDKKPPIVIDVRRDPERIDAWARSLPRAESVVVYCVHGHEVSQRAAAALAQARGLESGRRGAGAQAGERGHALGDPRTAQDRPHRLSLADRAVHRSGGRYDVPDVRFSHEGERCSFDAFLRHYRLGDTARLELAPQAPGLAAISRGLSRNFADDHEMLAHGMVMYDALYTWCREGKEEVHTWNPRAYR
jgi:hypothetical protein